MNILITGASGFIGGHLILQMVQAGHDVIALGRNFQTRIISEHVTYIEGNFSARQYGDLLQSLRICSPQVLVHLAGQAHLAQNEQNKVLFERNNVTLTVDVLTLAKQLNIKKFVFFSTVSVLNGDDSDIYAKTKRTAEEIVTTTCNELGIVYAIVRPVMVYGEQDVKGNMAKLIRQLDRGFFPLINQGKNIKDVLYVQNLVAAVVEIVKLDLWNNQVLLLKDPNTLTMNAICHTIIGALDHKCWLIPVPGRVISFMASGVKVLQRVGWFQGVNANSIRRLGLDVNFGQKLDEQLKLKMPFTTIQGLRQTVAWYLANK